MQIGNLRFDVFDDAVIGGGGGAKNRDFRRKQPQDADDAAVIGTEIVTPIGDAMGFVHDKHADAALDDRKKFLQEFSVAETFRRNHKDVHPVLLQSGFYRGPFGNVFAVDGDGADAEFFGSENLIAHERKQGTYKQGRASTSISQDFCGEEINNALAPPGALNYQDSLPSVGREIDSFPLAVAEVGGRPEHLLEQGKGLGFLHGGGGWEGKEEMANGK